MIASILGEYYQGSHHALNPEDAHHLTEYRRGAISSREFSRRVLHRLGFEVPPSLHGERHSDGFPSHEDHWTQEFYAPMAESWTDDLLSEPLQQPYREREPEPEPLEPVIEFQSSSSMSEDTAQIARGELDIAEWLKRAEEKYRTI